MKSKKTHHHESRHEDHESEHCHCGHGCGCCNHEHKHEHSHGESTIPRLATGGGLYILGLILYFSLSSLPILGIGAILVSYIILGYDVLLSAIRNIVRGHVFDENFLMGISTLGAIILGEYHEAVAVMLFYQIGEYFQGLAVRRSKKAIGELMDIRPDTVCVLRNGEGQTVPAESVAVGETVLIRPGERVALDGIVSEGSSSLDVKALTGESLPREVSVGDEILSGSVNQSGKISVKVLKSFGDSTATKIIELVENASSKKAKTENFITSFARIYTPAVVLLALMLALIPPIFFNASFEEYLHRALAFLVISCPCALVVSIPLSYFGGVGAAARHGILVKGGGYLEALTKLNTVIFDKTGTLTKGNFAVSGVFPTEGHTKDELLSLAASAESFSTHPISLSIIAARGDLPIYPLSKYRELSGFGIEASLDEKSLLVGKRSLLTQNGIDIPHSESVVSSVYVAFDRKYIGYISVTDEIKEQSPLAVDMLYKSGVTKVSMLTGDGEATAKAVADRLGINDFHSNLLPQQKLELIEAEISKKKRGTLAFVGDGINDAPSLARADIGIAMGGIGSDSAVEAADVVLMTDDPRCVAEAVRIARATRFIVIQNIAFILVIKLLFLVLGALGISGMWEAVFSDVGVALIAVLNSMRILKK